MFFERGEQLARREQLMFAKRIMQVLRTRLFSTAVGTLTNGEVHMPNHMVIAQNN